MSSALVLLSSYVINAVWQAPIIGAAGWATSRMLRRLGPQSQHAVWVLTLVLITMVPATSLLLGRAQHAGALSDVEVHGVSRLSGSAHSIPLLSANILLPSFVIYLLSILYLISLIAFALRLCWRFRCTMGLVTEATSVSLESEREQLWQRAAKAFSVESAVLLCSRRVPGPVAAGFRPGMLLLPTDFVENTTSAEFLSAVAHECAHISRHDFQNNLAYELAGLFTSFHPVTWMIKSQIAQTREMICDRMVADTLMHPHIYARSLLGLASKMPFTEPATISHAVGIFDNNTLETRIMLVKAKNARVRFVWRCCLITLATLVLVSAAGVSGTLTRNVAAQAANSSTHQSETANSHKHKRILSCTYWEEPQNVPHAGTCAVEKGEPKRYRCIANDNKALSQPQLACEPTPVKHS